jgi:N-acetylglucosamine kinase-like BadF-type ATPase
MPGRRLLLGVDGGNSKTHLALATGGGTLLAAIGGPTSSHQVVGLDGAADRFVALAEAAATRGGIDPSRRPLVDVAALCVAGADLPHDVRRLRAVLGATGVAKELRIQNDAFAPLRAGAARGWGVAVICGAGVNCIGVAPNGRVAGFPAYGDISGDWGGGSSVGMAGLQAAVRARDGRGQRTMLEQSVPAFFGLRRPIDVTTALYHHRLSERRLRELSPVVFGAAAEGDAAARSILDRLGDELAVMAIAIIRRLHLTRRDVDVVLAGGLFEARDDVLVARIAGAVQAVAPAASVRPLARPPVLGALLLALDAAGGSADAERRLRAATIVPEHVDLGPSRGG